MSISKTRVFKGMWTGITTAFLLVGLLPIVRGQVAAPPSVDFESRQKHALENPTPSPSPDIPDLSQIDQVFKQTSLGKQADERRTHLEVRRLGNEIANDPDVTAAKAAVKRARTDLEKRDLLRDYYALYYGRMESLATTPEMKSAVAAARQSHVSNTRQPRVRPGTDAPPPATPAPAVSSDNSPAASSPTPTPTPTPTPQRKHKKKHRHS